MSRLKLGQSCYKLDTITGAIIESTYGGPDWMERLGFVKPTRHELEVWLATIRNENIRRNNEG